MGNIKATCLYEILCEGCMYERNCHVNDNKCEDYLLLEKEEENINE